MSDEEKQAVVEEVVDELGWKDVKEVIDEFGPDFEPPEPDKLKDFTPDQKKIIEDFLDRTDIDDSIEDRIRDLLNPPEKDEGGFCPA